MSEIPLSRRIPTPDPPPPPTVSEIMQDFVANIKRILGLDINRLAIGSEMEGIVAGGPFGASDYTVTGPAVIEFVNVSTSIVIGTQTGT